MTTVMIVGLVWVLLGLAMALAVARMIRVGDQRQAAVCLFAFLEADLRNDAPLDPAVVSTSGRTVNRH